TAAAVKIGGKRPQAFLSPLFIDIGGAVLAIADIVGHAPRRSAREAGTKTVFVCGRRQGDYAILDDGPLLVITVVTRKVERRIITAIIRPHGEKLNLRVIARDLHVQVV